MTAANTEKKIKHYIYRGNYKLFCPVLIPGIVFFLMTFFESSYGMIHAVLFSFYFVLGVFIFSVKPVMVICGKDIRVKWINKVNVLDASVIKEIRCFKTQRGSIKSIHVVKNKGVALQIAMLFGFNADLAYPQVAEFAARNRVKIVFT